MSDCPNTRPRFSTLLSIAAVASLAWASIPATAAPAPIVSHATPRPVADSVERLDPVMDQLIPADATLEVLATGFTWSEGPVWMPPQAQLVFSDVPENIAYRWRESTGVDVFLQPSGLTGAEEGSREPGSNGLDLDLQGRLLLAQHGDRRIARLEADGRSFRTLADRFEGRRFNSPNDLCVARDGTVYFTDPPYGLGRDAKREIDFHGVYRLSPDGTVALITRELSRPNGIGLSPDEATLYVANSDNDRPIILALDLAADVSAGSSRVFFDGSQLKRRGAFDGLSVDEFGNLWATGPGGVLIITPEGRHVGTLVTGRATANCCFGGPDGTTLFVTADDQLMRIQTKVRGRRTAP